MKLLVKSFMIVGVVLCSAHAMANNQAKLALAKKVVLAGKVSPYATPSLKTMLKKAHEIDGWEQQGVYGAGCEFSESYYLGHGQESLTARNIKNWKAHVTSSGAVRATFNAHGVASLIEFDMVCKGASCTVDDVRHGSSDNPRVPPKYTQMSLRQDAQTMIAKDGCIGS